VKARRCPTLWLPRFGGENGQDQQRTGEQNRVDDQLAVGLHPLVEPMRVPVTQKQRQLIEGEAQGPDGWRASEPGEDVFAHHRLHEEDEEGTGKDRRGEEGC